MEDPRPISNSFFDTEPEVSQPSPAEGFPSSKQDYATSAGTEAYQNHYGHRPDSYPTQEQVVPHSQVIPNPVAVAPAAPVAPQWQDRAVYPVPQNIPQLPVGSGNSNEGNSSTGKSRTLLAFLAGGLIAAFAFGIAALIFNEDPIQVATTEAREISQVDDEDGEDLETTPLIEAGEVDPAVSVADALGPAVVQIEIFSGPQAGVGSGVVIDEDLILTNNHVIEGVDDVLIRDFTGRVLEGTVVGSDARIDVAVIEVQDSSLAVAQLATDDAATVGQSAIAIGSPFRLQQTVTQGIVSAVNRPIPSRVDGSFVPMIQTDAPINPGNSGGALADTQGRVIGINTSIQTDGNSASNAGVGFAIPIDTALDIAQRLAAGESIEPGFLGIEGSQPESGEAGVEVTSISGGSAASASSLEQGDIVRSVDGAPVTDITELAGLITVRTPGDTITLEVLRGTTLLEIDVTVGRRP